MSSLGKPHSGICSFTFPLAAWNFTAKGQSLAQEEKAAFQLGKQKDFLTTRLNVSAPEGVGTGIRGVSEGKTKPIAIYLSSKKAGNILKPNRQL